MNRRTRNIILLLVGLQIVLIGGLLALPTAVQAVPGRYRVALAERNPLLSDIAEGVMEAVAPVATALPAPSATDPGAEIDIAALIANNSEAVAVATVTPTLADLEPAAPITNVNTEGSMSIASDSTEAIAEETFAPTIAAPTATATPSPTPTPLPLPESHIIEGLVAVQQTFNNCGPANLTQVLNYYGDEITQADVAAYLKPNPEDRNVSPWQIADYVNEQTPGFNAIARSGGTLEMIKRFVAAGYPVVIEKGYEL
ncbi:MAG: C39 family peptidase, partial [Candidatus Promineifilaceae bacterium]